MGQIFTFIRALASRNCNPKILINDVTFNPPCPCQYIVGEVAGNYVGQVFIKEMAYRIPDNVHVSFISVEQGKSICLMHIKSESSKGALIYSHANAVDCGGMLPRCLLIAEKVKVDVFVYDYEGYGYSDGLYSCENICRDIEAVYRVAVSLYNPNRIFLYGESIGSVPACNLAAKLCTQRQMSHHRSAHVWDAPGGNRTRRLRIQDIRDRVDLIQENPNDSHVSKRNHSPTNAMTGGMIPIRQEVDQLGTSSMFSDSPTSTSGSNSDNDSDNPDVVENTIMYGEQNGTLNNRRNTIRMPSNRSSPINKYVRTDNAKIVPISGHDTPELSRGIESKDSPDSSTVFDASKHENDVYSGRKRRRGESRFDVMSFIPHSRNVISDSAMSELGGVILHSALLSGGSMLIRCNVLRTCDPFDNSRTSAAIDCPVFHIHGMKDEIVPFADGKEMHHLTQSSYEPWWVPDSHHNDIVNLHPQEYFQRLSAFVNTCLQRFE